MNAMEAAQDSHDQTVADYNLMNALRALCTDEGIFPDVCTMILEVSIHMEEGAEKYGANNWRKGIPGRCYFDSALRHYLKWFRGDNDERHDSAVAWNVMCLIWELRNHDQGQYDEEDNSNES